MKFDLRGKILLGSLFLLIPLALTTVSLLQYGTRQIQASSLELKGLVATGELIDAMLAWQEVGPDGDPTPEFLKEIQEFQSVAARFAADLGYSEAAMSAAGFYWTPPEELLADAEDGASGVFNRFLSFHETLGDQAAYLKGSSGLVFDPELPSHSLVVALHEHVPDLISILTDLRLYSRPATGALGREALMTLYSTGSRLRAAGRGLEQVLQMAHRSLRSSHPILPPMTSVVESQLPPLMEEIASLGAFTNRVSLGDALVPQELESSILTVLRGITGLQKAVRLCLEKFLSDRVSELTLALFVALGESLIGLVIAAIVVLVVVRSVRLRAAVLDRILAALAHGDLGTEVPQRVMVSNDELGNLARSVHRVRADLGAQVIHVKDSTLVLVTLGQKLGENSGQSAAAIEQMTAAASMVARNSSVQRQLTEAASGKVTDLLGSISTADQKARDLAIRFEEFHATLSGSLTTLKETAAHARRTDDLAGRLMATGQGGENDLAELRTSIENVAGKAEEVQGVVQVIIDIAERSSILSLNAAIEAAHAGEAGRGFAVVADEIQKLASTSSQQARAIRELLEEISAATRQTIERSDDAGRGFRTLLTDIHSVREASQTISQQMGHQEVIDAQLTAGLQEVTLVYRSILDDLASQSAGSQSIQTTLRQLADSSQEIDHSMQEQNLGMSQASQAVGQVRDSALELASVIEGLRGLVAHFQLEVHNSGEVSTHAILMNRSPRRTGF